MVSAGINYRETYFEFPELTKLQGEPTAESLYKLRNELKANAQAVTSSLSDGTHGHLALVLSATQYALLTDQPFVRPVHPGELVIATSASNAIATVVKGAHDEAVRLFREVQGVEKALIQQIVQAIAAPYLSSIRDRTSNSLRGTVHEILEHLQEVYGRVSPQMLEDRDNELRGMVYNTQLPIDVVFNAVEDYVDFADLANQPLTTSQTIAKAYVILNKTRRFKNDITAWNRRSEDEKTWEGFKTHFRRAHQDFRETTDVTLEDSELQRSNANLVQQVVNGMQQAMAAETETDANAARLLQEANQLLNSKIQEMQQSMNLLQTQVANQGSGGNQQGFQGQNQQYGNSQQGRGYQGRGYQGRGYQGRNYQGRGHDGGSSTGVTRQRNTSIYCWTHGGCGHTSATCLSKQNGHQNNATFTDKKGGSTRNCQM